MSIKRVLWFMLIITSNIAIVSAQAEACSSIIQEILMTVEDACEDLGRNQICYGNDNVTALNFAESPIETFTSVGNTTDVIDVASLATAPFDSNNDVWGIALLSLQADLPDTLPGQNVTFVVFGDTQLTNHIVPDTAIVSSLTAQSTGNINIRAGAGTSFEIVGTLTNGESLTLIGRDATGDWVQIETDEGSAWVFAELLIIEGTPNLLPMISDMQTDNAPLQAFSLQTGIGQTTCQEAPPNGVLIQAPTDTTVHFTVNGMEVEIGSTAFMQMNNGNLEVSNLDGNVMVTNFDESQIIDPGYQVTISEDAPPSEQTPYDYEDFQYLPVELLPEAIGIPLLILSDNVWRDTGVAVEAGDTVFVVAGGVINFWDNCETEKVANGQPDIDCSSLILGPNGGDPTTVGGAPLPSDMSLFPVSTAPAHSLVGRVGTDTFFVGTGGTFTVTASGTLEFRTNDIDNNNVGAFFVAVIPTS